MKRGHQSGSLTEKKRKGYSTFEEWACAVNRELIVRKVNREV